MPSCRTFGAVATNWRSRRRRTSEWRSPSTNSPWQSDPEARPRGFSMPQVGTTHQTHHLPRREQLGDVVVGARLEVDDAVDVLLEPPLGPGTARAPRGRRARRRPGPLLGSRADHATRTLRKSYRRPRGPGTGSGTTESSATRKEPARDE